MASTWSGGTQDEGQRGGLGRLRRGKDPVYDPTTRLPARNHLFEFAAEAIERSKATSGYAVVAFIDIGMLRDVNDAFGVDAGDYLLRAVATRLSSIDLPGTRAVRYGSAEFAVVFENIAGIEMAEEIARFLIDLLTPGFRLGNDEFSVTPTVGAAISADNYNNVEDFVRDAHRSLVKARDFSGAGTYAVHDESKRGRYETRIDEARLSKAIDNEEFLLAYQPIIRLDTNMIIGFEALLRWQDPGATTSGVIFPHDFMPMLEKTGMSVRLGHWVIREACRQAVAWNRRFPDRPALFITCNLGARQLASVDFKDKVVEAISSTGVQPWQLCLDITEQALRFNRAGAWAALRELKDHGVKLGLDDFGTGVSSLSYLRTFQLDLVRVDRTFVSDLVLSKEDRAIVKHIAGMAHDLGLIAVAEGVETSEQVDILRKLGVDMAQGYHFGRPQFAADATLLLDPNARDMTWATGQVTTYGH